jgi:hypothetical protein
VFLPFKLGEKWDDLELDEIKKIADGINQGNIANPKTIWQC